MKFALLSKAPSGGGFVLLSMITTTLCNADFASDRETFEALGDLSEVPAMQEAEGYESSEAMRAIYFNALEYKGKPTKVFAWLGMPQQAAEAGAKVPAMVLVHGGGGTAFKEWVERWNERGYAAISIAVEGQTDQKPGSEGGHWKKHPWGGPSRVGIYGDTDEPIKDQWMYHAVADTILAHNLIRSLPGVDGDKVGIMGISWGGVITSTVIGLDGRFAFAIPTYGCGDLAEAQNQYGKSLGNNGAYKHVYDPMLRLENVEMPTLWFSWPEDKHFPMDKFANCYRKVSGPYMVSLIPKMGHGHGPPWNKPDSYAFADSITRQGKPWCRQSSLERDGNKVIASFEASEELSEPVLVYSTEKGFTGKRKWIEQKARGLKKGGAYVVEAELPAGVTGWFINVQSGELTASSAYKEE
ncbi:MAG: alpha/beta hydrolase family protein [Akkermansiaceae bacterium]